MSKIVRSRNIRTIRNSRNVNITKNISEIVRNRNIRTIRNTRNVRKIVIYNVTKNASLLRKLHFYICDNISRTLENRYK